MKNKNIVFNAESKNDNDFYNEMKIVIVEDLKKINESLNKAIFEFNCLHGLGNFIGGNQFNLKETILKLDSNCIFELSFGVNVNKKTNISLLDTTYILINLKGNRNIILTLDLENKNVFYSKPSAASDYYHKYTKNKNLKNGTCEKVTKTIINNNVEVFKDNYVFSTDFKTNLSIFNMFLMKNGVLNKEFINKLSENKSLLDFKNITESLELLCLEHDLRYKTPINKLLKTKNS